MDFDRLFYTQGGASSDPGEADYGFYSEKGAIPRGTTLLVTGPPGVGKTNFALSLVRSLYVGHYRTCQVLRDDGDLEPVALREPDFYADLPILYYVSLEIFPEKLRQAVAPFGWLTPDDEFFRENEGDQEEEGSQGSRPTERRPTMRIITATPEVDRPVPGAEELLSSIFAQIGRAQAREEENRKVFVIIDSITALIRARGDYSERRRQTHETIHRLKKLFQENQLLLTILIAESDSEGSREGQSDNMVEEYLADMVFRLNTHQLPLGRRLRTLEIPKSQGVNVIIGEHTWLILTMESIDSLIGESAFKKRILKWVGAKEDALEQREKLLRKARQPDLDAQVKESIERELKKLRYGTVVILPRSLGLSHKSSRDLGSKHKRAVKQIWSGTRGLDAMLDYDAEDWLTEVPLVRELAAKQGGSKQNNTTLDEGSTTLLVGAAGSGKTGIGLQFLFRYWLDAAPAAKCAPVLITFDYGSEAFNKTIEGHWNNWQKVQTWKPAPPSFEKSVTTLVFRQAHIDLNLVVAQVRECILGHEEDGPERLLIDGLSEWLSTFEGRTREQVLEALLNSIFEARAERKTPVPLTIMICYEVDMANPQALAATYAIPAQNIFVIKQVSIQDKTRRVIYLEKAEMKKSDRAVREVRRSQDNGPLQITASLDEFNRVLLPEQIEPASVSLQFFAENSAERAWTRWALRHLKRLKPLKYREMSFGRVENSRTFEHAEGFGGSPELRLISVDEWWIHGQPRREPGEPGQGKGLPMLNLANLWHAADDSHARPTHQGLEGNWSDYWCFEVEKARGRSEKRKDPGEGESSSEPIREGDNLFAVPAYMDFSLFCVNLRLLHKEFQAKERRRDETAGLPHAVAEFFNHRSEPAKSPAGDDTRSNQMHPEKQRLLREVWHQASDAFPHTWVPPDWQAGVDWFQGETRNSLLATPSLAGSMLELIPFRNRGEHSPKLFAVDTSTPESLSCVWLEMAWAFGAQKDFLNVTQETGEAFEEFPETKALVFLQELVLRGLMPARATLERTKEALFTRQWYSTICYLARDTAEPDQLLPIPFWPVRSDLPATWLDSLREALERFQRTIIRTQVAMTAVLEFTSGGPPEREEKEVKILAEWKSVLQKISNSLEERLHQLPQILPSVNQWDAALAHKILAATIEDTNEYYNHLQKEIVRQRLQNPPAVGQRQHRLSTKRPPLHWPDYRDLVEIFQSHTLRLGLVIASVMPERDVLEEAGEWGKVAAPGNGQEEPNTARSGTMRAILKLWRSNPYQVPLAENLLKSKKLEPGSTQEGRRYAATLTGYSTSGSWLYSVHRRSLSLSLAKPLLEELTSLQAAEERANLGAGLPARKDFYATSGDEYAPYCENLSWRDILRFAGSRCRERAQAVSPQDDILARFHLISERLLDLLQRAYDDRPQDAGGMQEKLEKAVERAVQFVREIRQSVIDACNS